MTLYQYRGVCTCTCTCTCTCVVHNYVLSITLYTHNYIIIFNYTKYTSVSLIILYKRSSGDAQEEYCINTDWGTCIYNNYIYLKFK